jgi:hypothetical protein
LFYQYFFHSSVEVIVQVRLVEEWQTLLTKYFTLDIEFIFHLLEYYSHFFFIFQNELGAWIKTGTIYFMENMAANLLV